MSSATPSEPSRDDRLREPDSASPRASSATPAVDRDVHRPDGRRIETTIRVAAPPERVWRAWADPADLSRWFTDDARGEVVPGGTITWIFREFGIEIPYPVTIAEPGRRLVLSGEMPGRGAFALEVLLEGEDEGEGTLVRLVNSGFLDGAEWEDEYEGVASGWRMALALLKEYLERHAGEAKRTILLFRPAAPGYRELAGRFYAGAEGPATWLTRSGAIGSQGAPVELILQDGRPLTGRVLVRTDTEVSLSWSEEDAVLELKAFRMGPEPMLGVRVTGWGWDEARADALHASLEPAVERLARASAEAAGGAATGQRGRRAAT